MAKCYDYCKKQNRQLFINTDRSGLLDDFSAYFHAPDPRITLGSHDAFKKLIAAQTGTSAFTDTHPPALQLGTPDYQSILEKKYWVDQKTRALLTFDFLKSYQEVLLVHEQHGGGKGIDFLEHLRLNPLVLATIRHRIQTLGRYDAVHIRNTDYKTDYKPLLKNIIPNTKIPVVICTDDKNVQQHAIEQYGDKVRLTHALPDLSATKTSTLHGNADLDRYETNLNTLADLFTLASARRLHITKLTDEQPRKTSGFLMLALSLRKRKDVLIRILSDGNLTQTEKATSLLYAIKQTIHRAAKQVRLTTRPIRRKLHSKTKPS
jgi:hypothetical protein